MNPGKIVRPSRMDDRSLFRFKPGLCDAAARPPRWIGASGAGCSAAVEMCNNNGHCRKFDAGTMCPSYRATLDEQHLTRGRANTLRLALSGQLGPDALVSDAMRVVRWTCAWGARAASANVRRASTWRGSRSSSCISITVAHGYRLQDKLVAYLPRYAPLAARLGPVLNLRNRIPLLAKLSQAWLGLSAKRSLAGVACG